MCHRDEETQQEMVRYPIREHSSGHAGCVGGTLGFEYSRISAEAVLPEAARGIWTQPNTHPTLQPRKPVSVLEDRWGAYLTTTEVSTDLHDRRMAYDSQIPSGALETSELHPSSRVELDQFQETLTYASRDRPTPGNHLCTSMCGQGQG